MNQFTRRRRKPSLVGTPRHQWERRDQRFWKEMMKIKEKIREKRNRIVLYIFGYNEIYCAS